MNVAEKTKSTDLARVFPNPATDRFYIQWDKESEIRNLKLRVHDNAGRLAKETILSKGGSEEIDIKSLKAGVYFVIISDKDGRHYYQSSKLVKLP
jgi:hypothetical protein